MILSQDMCVLHKYDTHLFSYCEIFTMEDNEIRFFVNHEFYRHLAWNKILQFINIKIQYWKRNVKYYSRPSMDLPLTSKVVRLGWMVILYRVGWTNVGSLILFHGNISPVIAIGMRGFEEFKLPFSFKLPGSSPAQGQSGKS